MVEGNRWVVPCQAVIPVSGSITGAWVPPEHEIDWHWMSTREGNYVSGYLVRPKIAKVKVLKKAKRSRHAIFG